MSEVPNSPNQQSNRKDPQPIIQAQIVFLASTLNDENLDRNWSEIKSVSGSLFKNFSSSLISLKFYFTCIVNRAAWN